MEIGYLLEEFQRQRSVCTRRTKDAIDQYEAELRQIGDTAEFEQMYSGEGGPGASADHNLLRHLQISKPAHDFGYDLAEMEEEEYKDAFAEINAKLEEKSKSRLFTSEPMRRPEPVSSEQKEAIREQLFAFLGESNEDERRLVSS